MLNIIPTNDNLATLLYGWFMYFIYICSQEMASSNEAIEDNDWSNRIRTSVMDGLRLSYHHEAFTDIEIEVGHGDFLNNKN